MIHPRHPTLTLALMTALALLAAACGGDSDDAAGNPSAMSAATEANSTTTAGAPAEAATTAPTVEPAEGALTAEDWVAAFCVAYATWDAQAFPSDGIDPTTLDLEERLERANQSVRTITSATDDFVDHLAEANAPASLDPYREELLDDAEFLLWDMEDFVDDPAENLQDLDDISVTLNVRVEVLRDTAARQLATLPPEDLAAFDANPDCAAVPR